MNAMTNKAEIKTYEPMNIEDEVNDVRSGFLVLQTLVDSALTCSEKRGSYQVITLNSDQLKALHFQMSELAAFTYNLHKKYYEEIDLNLDLD